MDWRSVRFDWNRARAFLVTAEEGSLSAAARALRTAQPTVGRQVAALEAELGVLLFDRVGRGLSLTAAGLDLLEHVRSMGDAATLVSLGASGKSQSIAGPISITASEVISAFLLPPVVARIRRDYPKVELTIVASNTVRDLRRREADIAIRSGKPTEPSLVATRVRDMPARLYAAPSYLKKIGNPKTIADLARADFIGFTNDDRFLDGMNALGFGLTRDNFPIHTESHPVLWELTKQGLGIGVIIEEIGDAEPMVRRVLESLAPIPVPTWLVTHREVHTSKRVRVIFDLLAEHFHVARHTNQKPKLPGSSEKRARSAPVDPLDRAGELASRAPSKRLRAKAR